MLRRPLAVLTIALAAPNPAAAAEPFHIVTIENAAGTEVRQADKGFRLGLDYATKGSLSAGGYALDVTVLDDRGDPALAASLLANGLRDSRADIAVSLDAAPGPELTRVAADLDHVLLLARGGDPASNHYVFRTGHSPSQLALACVTALGVPELNLFSVAPDTSAGHDAVTALKDALERVPRGVFFAGAKFIRPDQTDIGATVSSEYDDLHYLHGAKTLLMLWSGGPQPPVPAIAATNPGRFGIRLALCGDLDAGASDQPLAALEGVTSYFYSLARNAANDWLIAQAAERTREKPDAAMAEGMSAAIALVQALASARSAATDALIASLEGLSFETPKGRMVIGQNDHRALQAMYQFRIEPPANRPELVRVIGAPSP